MRIYHVVSTTAYMGLLLLQLPAYAEPITLEQAMQQAGDAHPEVRMAEQGVAAAQGILTEKSSYAYNPEVLIEPQRRRLADRSGITNDYFITLSQGIEIPGKRSNRSRAARAGLDAAEDSAENVRQRRMIAAARAAAMLDFSTQIKHVRQQQQNIMQRLLEAVNQGFKAGEKSMLDVNLARASFANSLSMVAQARQGYLRAEEDMANALGLPYPLHTNHSSESTQTGQNKVRCAGEGGSPAKHRNVGMTRLGGFPSGEPLTGHLSALRSLARERPLPRERALHLTGQRLAEERFVCKGQGLPDKRRQELHVILPSLNPGWRPPVNAMQLALASRPDLQAVKANTRAGEARAQLADLNRIPDPTLSLLTGRDTNDRIIGFGVNIPIPVLNAHTGAYKTAIAERERTRDMEQWSIIKLKREVATVISEHEVAARTLTSFLQGQTPAAEDNIRLAQTAYENGEMDLSDLVIYLDRSLQARTTRFELLKRMWLAHIRVAEVLGHPEYILKGIQQ